MSQPAFSVLSSVPRTEPHLDEMIQSVLAQTFQDWELIVVDGSGVEDNAAVVGKYSDDPRVRLVRSESDNRAAGVNTAADTAVGAYFTVLHGNHVLAPEFFARLHEVVVANPDIDVLTVDARGFHDDGTTAPHTFRQEGGVESEPGVRHSVTLAEFVDGSVLYYSAAVKAAVWRQTGGQRTDLPMVEGLVLFARMLADGADVRVLPEDLAGFRLPEDPAMFAVYENTIQQAFLEIDTMTDDPAVHAASARKLRDARFHQAMRGARAALAESDTTTARTQIRRALAQRREVKPALIYAALTVAPGGLRRLQAAKRRLRAG